MAKAKARWTRDQRRRWPRLIARLTDKHPIGRVYVEFRPSRDFGRCLSLRERNAKHRHEAFLLEISDRLDFGSACYTLCEEWAHAMAGERRTKSGSYHTDHWGVCYARVIRSAEEFDDEQ